MKKLILLTLVIASASTVYSQNVQLHYDFGEDRKMPTTTFEMFKPDAKGSTFFFIDLNFGGKTAEVSGVSLAYLELARELKLGKSPFALHAEINSGTFRTKDFAGPIHTAYLLGGSYSINNKNFTKTFSLQLLYKHIQDKNDLAYQITTVWGLHFFNRSLSFTGFTDFWREDNVVFDENGTASDTRFVFLSEPQLWYHLNTHFSVGGEVELSANFGGHQGFMMNPTLGLKWTF